MDNRDSKALQLDLQLSPQLQNCFYFPCGSISSYQNSLESPLEEIHDSFFAQQSIENEEKLLDPMDFISYDQFSIEKMRLEETKTQLEFTASFEAASKFSEIGVNVDFYLPEIEVLSEKLNEKTKACLHLVAELKAVEKVKNELEKIVKNAKSEVEMLKNKLKCQENEFLKVKVFIDDICDEEGNSKTSRANVAGYGVEGLLNKLELIKYKMMEFKGKVPNANPRKFLSPAKATFLQKLTCLPSEKFIDVEDEVRTERPKSSLQFHCEGNDKITYKEVLRDLKEITTRASKALKNSSLNRRSSNLLPYPRASAEKLSFENNRMYRNF